MLQGPITIELRIRDCYCHTCDKSFHHLGIASHRAKHRRRQENCKITYSNGKTFIHYFSTFTQENNTGDENEKHQ